MSSYQYEEDEMDPALLSLTICYTAITRIENPTQKMERTSYVGRQAIEALRQINRMHRSSEKRGGGAQIPESCA
jgi:hypothetical protein